MSGPSARTGIGEEVTLHLALTLADGTVVVSTFGTEPLCCRFGDGTLAAGLELQLEGLAAGESRQLELPGSLLFGGHDDERVQWLPRSDFPGDLETEPGSLIEFRTPAGERIAGRIVERAPERVRVDFNHPLAGVQVRVRAEIIAVGGCR